MKIILSESQLRLVISESINVNRLNYLLDKVSDSGIESLSQEEKEDLDDMSNGRNIRKRKHVEPEERPQSSAQPHSNISSQPDFGGFNPNDGEEDGEEMEAPLRHFMDFAPKKHSIMVGNTKWGIEPIEDNTGLHLKISDGEKEFHLTPFVNNMNRTLLDYLNGETDIWNITKEVKPNEMKEYVKLFYSQGFHAFIKLALNKL
jgi:hypothetical protein